MSLSNLQQSQSSEWSKPSVLWLLVILPLSAIIGCVFTVGFVLNHPDLAWTSSHQSASQSAGFAQWEAMQARNHAAQLSLRPTPPPAKTSPP